MPILRRKPPKFYKTKRPLRVGHIRLLTLFSGSEGSKIECDLQPVSFSSLPAYDALSYVWGQSSQSETDTTIIINGHEITIQENLWLALNHLRHLTSERVLWIDAICINQKDDKEKSIQVQQMGTVYARASSVVAWLGLSNRDSKAVLEFFHRIIDNPDIKNDAIDLALFQNDRVWGGPNSMSYSESEWTLSKALIINLGRRPYWKRLWILQEVVLGTNDVILQFGHDLLSWDDFGKCIARLRRYLEALPSTPGTTGYRNVHSLQWALETGTSACLHNIKLMRMPVPGSCVVSLTGSGNPFRHILGLAQMAQCQKVQDKIYGLLGMADFGIRVDYKMSLFDLYTEALNHFKHALNSGPGDPPEIYTARLSQILQDLLNGPLDPKDWLSRVPCVKMSGVWAGEIFHVVEPGSGPSCRRNSSVERIDDTMKSDLTEALRWLEKEKGYQLTTLSHEMLAQFFEYPKLHVASPCRPHHFYATKRSSSPESFTGHHRRCFRRGSVPVVIDSKPSYEPLFELPFGPQLFIASKERHLQAGHTVLGFAPLNAQLGDHIVRFLETDACLIVRDSGAGDYRFIGSAFIPRTGDTSTDIAFLDRQMRMDHSWVRGSALSYEQFQNTFGSGDGIDIVLDVETLQFVTNNFRREP